MSRPTSHTSLFSVTFLSLDRTCLSQTVGGRWPAHMSLHINILELLTVGKMIKHFVPLLQNQHVLIYTDNKVAAGYINHQGGMHSVQML